MQIGIYFRIIIEAVICTSIHDKYCRFWKQLHSAVGDILPESVTRRSMLGFRQHLVEKLLERAPLPPSHAAAVLLDDMLMHNLYFTPEIVHAQQVGNRIRFVGADVMYGMTDADMLECRMSQSPFCPRRSVVEIVFESEFFVTHVWSVIRLHTFANRLLDFPQPESVVFADIKPVDDPKHPPEIRTVIAVIRHAQHRIVAVAIVFQCSFDRYVIVECRVIGRRQHFAVECGTTAIHLLRQIEQKSVHTFHAHHLLGSSCEHSVEQYLAFADKGSDLFELFLGMSPAEIVGIHSGNAEYLPFDALQPSPQITAVIDV